jgi:hypothetical protein
MLTFFSKQISLADIIVADLLDQVTDYAALPSFPGKLGALMERVKNYPKLKDYLASRN